MTSGDLSLIRAAHEGAALARTASLDQIIHKVRTGVTPERLVAIMALGGLVSSSGPLHREALDLLSQTLESDLDTNCRWQAAIVIGMHIETRSDEVWGIASRAGASLDEDVRAAVATCILEHLIERDERYLGEARRLASMNPIFRDTLKSCWYGVPKRRGGDHRDTGRDLHP